MDPSKHAMYKAEALFCHSECSVWSINQSDGDWQNDWGILVKREIHISKASFHIKWGMIVQIWDEWKKLNVSTKYLYLWHKCGSLLHTEQMFKCLGIMMKSSSALNKLQWRRTGTTKDQNPHSQASRKTIADGRVPSLWHPWIWTCSEERPRVRLWWWT